MRLAFDVRVSNFSIQPRRILSSQVQNADVEMHKEHGKYLDIGFIDNVVGINKDHARQGSLHSLRRICTATMRGTAT